jgi:hypothetical protein
VQRSIVEFASVASARDEAEDRVVGGAAIRSLPAPPGTRNAAKTPAEYNREWRQRHPDAVREYNERRRIPPTEKRCTECRAIFLGRKDRLVCSRRCRTCATSACIRRRMRRSVAARKRDATHGV